METIVSALIGGMFSLLGVWLGNYLQQRNRAEPAYRDEIAPAAVRSPAPRAATDRSASAGKRSDVKRGLLLLVADFVLIAVVVNAFHLDTTNPWWNKYFAALTLGAIPMFALYLIVRGLWRKSLARQRQLSI